MNFGNALHYYRKKTGLRQEDIAKELKISRQAYSNYEKGIRIPDIYRAYKISIILGVSLDAMMKEVDEYPPYDRNFSPV